MRVGITGRIRPDALRHAFAAHAPAEGADIKAVAELMGHITPTMIYHHYQHVLNKQRKAAIEAIPDLIYVPEKCASENEALEIMGYNLLISLVGCPRIELGTYG